VKVSDEVILKERENPLKVMVKRKEMIEYIFPRKGLYLFSKCHASVFYEIDSAMNENSILKRTILSETVYLLHC